MPSDVQSHAQAPCCASKAPARLLKAMRAILVPVLGLPPRPDGAKATKRSHLGDIAVCTGPGSRGRLRPERRLVLGFSWSLNCGGFAWALTKAAHAPEGILAVLQGGRPPQTKRQPPESPATAPDKLRPLTSQSRAREAVQPEIASLFAVPFGGHVPTQRGGYLVLKYLVLT